MQGEQKREHESTYLLIGCLCLFRRLILRKEGRATQHNRRGDGHIGIDREKKRKKSVSENVQLLLACVGRQNELHAQLSFIPLCNLITAICSRAGEAKKKTLKKQNRPRFSSNLKTSRCTNNAHSRRCFTNNHKHSLILRQIYRMVHVIMSFSASTYPSVHTLAITNLP